MHEFSPHVTSPQAFEQLVYRTSPNTWFACSYYSISNDREEAVQGIIRLDPITLSLQNMSLRNYNISLCVRVHEDSTRGTFYSVVCDKITGRELARYDASITEKIVERLFAVFPHEIKTLPIPDRKFDACIQNPLSAMRKAFHFPLRNKVA